MKLKFIIPILFFVIPVGKVSAGVDPVTAASVVAQNVSLKKTYDERLEEQKKLKKAEEMITIGLTAIHDVEKKTLGYLTEISKALSDLNQIKTATSLTIQIPKEAADLIKTVKQHPKQAIFATIVTKELTRLTAEASTLYPFLQQLVTTGTYNQGKEKHKVNLLNSAERFYILNTVCSKLNEINWCIRTLKYQIQFFSWSSFLYRLDPEGWCSLVGSEIIMRDVIYRWKNFK